jgi:hypothetical protein
MKVRKGDFLAAAEKVTPEMINLATHGRGLICAPLRKRCKGWDCTRLTTLPILWKLLLRFGRSRVRSLQEYLPQTEPNHFIFSWQILNHMI